MNLQIQSGLENAHFDEQEEGTVQWREQLPSTIMTGFDSQTQRHSVGWVS